MLDLFEHSYASFMLNIVLFVFSIRVKLSLNLIPINLLNLLDFYYFRLSKFNWRLLFDFNIVKSNKFFH